MLVAAERLMTHAVSMVDRDDEIWLIKLDSTVRLVDEVQWLHWTDRVEARICGRHAKRGDYYERLTRAKVTRVLEKCGMQEGEMHAQMVRHAYVGMAAGLARTATQRCVGRGLLRCACRSLRWTSQRTCWPRRTECLPLTGRATGICTRRSRERTKCGTQRREGWMLHDQTT